MNQRFDAIILGGGAAGLFCAAEAGKRGRRVVVLERANRIGKKILISGGGRCNFTNINCTADNFISANPHFCKSALSRYGSADFIALVEKYRIAYHEKTMGQLFCDGSSAEILSMLEEECRRAKVTIATNVEVVEVSRDSEFLVSAKDREFRAPVLVVATGGLSIPKMGATGFGYDIARRFGHNIRECRPALVPLMFRAEDRKRYSELAGVSTEVIATTSRSPDFREKVLFTHAGLSGPAILQVSSYWKKDEPVHIDLSPDGEVFAPLMSVGNRRDATAARSALRQALPARLADRWLDYHQPSSFTNQAVSELERQIHNWEVVPSGTEGYDKAEVTAGGVDTDELSSKTMESRRVKGLFFIGEVVDVTGQLGGYNFQWAWSSAFSAGQAI